jgi:hypothetical protein
LDEGVEIIARLWTGDPVSFEGQHYHLDNLQLTPVPVQKPRIPIWVGGDWLVKGVRRRLTRWDGCCVYKGPPGEGEVQLISPSDVREMLSLVERERGTVAGFDVCIGGGAPRNDSDEERDHIRSLAEAGVTWWQEWVPPGDVEQARQSIARGPLRID